MVLFNYSTKELTAKVVYYGPGLCGKTTNLQWIHEKLPIRNKGKMLSLATEADRTLFFDFLPIELGSIRGMKTRIQLYTVPGQVFYNATRRMVLKGADCVVFVADSQEAMIDADLDSLANLRENLEVNEINPDEIPMVLQYNKRDLPNALPVEILNERLNPRGVPFFEAVAKSGAGVEETLKGATTMVFRSLAGKYGGGEAAKAAPPPGPATIAAPVRAAAPPAAPAPAPRPAAPPAPRPAPVAAAAAPAPPRPAAPSPSRSSEDPLLDLTPAPSVRPSDLQSTDDMLNSLDLGAESGGSSDLDLDADVEETVEELEVLPDDGPEPVAPPPPERPGRTTLVKGPDEGAEMRRKIGRPSLPVADDALDELSMDEDVQEIAVEPPARKGHSFTGLGDEVRPAPAPPPRAPAPSPRAPALSPAPGPVRVSAPAPAAPAVRADFRQHLEPAPVTVPVEISIAPGEHEVTVPIEVTVGRPGTAGHVRVHVALKIKIS